MIKKIAELLAKIPQEQRKKLDGLQFIVSKDSLQIDKGGRFIKGEYYRDNSIIIYEALIRDDEDLKNTLLHEICHHFGLNEEETRRLMK